MLGTSPWPSGPDAFLYAERAGRQGSSLEELYSWPLSQFFSLTLFAEKSILQTQLALAESSWGWCSGCFGRCGPDTPLPALSEPL